MKGAAKGGGEIVQVEGGHILRSTGLKDRHSKVYTSRGPRDRRVRLSAHTAIQFYDVQDRLGYDRPSKAVDWLIKKAKTAIDNLAPANPTSTDLAWDHQSETHSGFAIIQPDANPGFSNSTFTAPPDAMKSFSPTTNFPGFSNDGSVSRAAQDLGLSLHTFQGNSDGFQECFPRVHDGWSSGVDMDNRVGFLMSLPENSPQAAVFSYRELLQSNLAVNQWPLSPADQHNPQPYSGKTPGSECPFELEFRVPARIYGDGEPDNRR